MTLQSKLTASIVKEYHSDILSFVDAELVTIDQVQKFLDLTETADKILKKIPSVNEFYSLIQTLREFLIPDIEEFLKTTAITIPFNGDTRIYVPWIPGDISTASFYHQVVVISHEATHAYRARKAKIWLSRYIKSFTFRCAEEREAFLTSMEMIFLLTGRSPSVGKLVRDMDGYFLRPTDEEVLAVGLKAALPPIVQGDRTTPIGQWAARWFADNNLIQ